MALPTHIGRVRFADGAAAAEGDVHAVVVPSDGGFRASVVDASGAVLVEMEGYRTIALPTALDDEVVGPLRTAMS